MKKLVLLVPLFFFALGMAYFIPSSSALASVLQITATSSLAPSPSPVPTLTPVSSDCPLSLPAGWGFYTPSPLWMAECGACDLFITPTVTPTIQVQPTYNGTGTPAATYTPVPTSTLMYTPTVTPAPFSAQIVSCSNNNADTNNCTVSPDKLTADYNYVYTWGWEWAKSSMVVNSQVPFYVIADFDSVVNGVPNYTTHTACNFGLVGIGAEGYDCQYWGQSTSGHYYSVWAYAGNPVYPYETTITLENGLSPNDQPAHKEWIGSFTISSTDPSVVTPTPTPGPSLGYCSSVMETEDEFGFELFQPDGAPNCNVGWDSFTAGGFDVPAVRICFQPSIFGVITLFGQSYEIGVYALAAAAAFFYRYFRQG